VTDTETAPDQRARAEAATPPQPSRAEPTEVVRRDRGWPTRETTVTLTVGAFYALLVSALWLPFGPRSGMGYETTLVYLSESKTFWDGFIYWDALRPFTQLFYQSGYQLSSVLGIDGSFLGYQLVYAALWWGRGLLVFLILRRLFPALPVLAYAAGGLVIVHASDRALNWVGQLNQFGFIFWMLLAIYFLVVALQLTRRSTTCIAAAAAAGATYLCLWSYESPLFILLLAPVVLVHIVGVSFRSATVVLSFYVVPAVFVAKNIDRYVGRDSGTYQESLVRDELSPLTLGSDLAYNVRASVSFWEWGTGLPPAAHAGATLAGVAAATVFGIGALVVGLLVRHRAEALPRARVAFLLGTGLVLLLASFPAYLVLEDARGLWRSQFLSGIGFGVVAAALLFLAASFIGDRRLRVLTVAVVGAAVAYAGGAAAYRAASFHYDNWQRHREAMAQVLEVAPRLKSGTVVVLGGVSKDADSFGHNMWFDVALRLAYPDTPVAGIYYYADGEPAPGANMLVRGRTWYQIATGFPTLVDDSDFSNTVIVRYSAAGRPALAAAVPRFMQVGRAARSAYSPLTPIEQGEASPLAERRYEPDGG